MFNASNGSVILEKKEVEELLSPCCQKKVTIVLTRSTTQAGTQYVYACARGCQKLFVYQPELEIGLQVKESK